MDINEIATKEDLRDMLNDLSKKIEDTLESKREEVRFIKSKQVREMLSISEGTLKEYRIKGVIKYQKVNGTFYYKEKEIIGTFSASKI
jgi:hypothetical protein